MNPEILKLIEDLALTPLGSELIGDYPDSAFNENLDEFIRRAREIKKGTP